MKINQPSFILILVLMTFLGCKSTKTSDSKKNQSQSSIAENKINIDGTWILSSLNGDSAKEIFKRLPTLTVNLSTKTIYGNGGCNRYNGSFTLSGNIFSAPRLATTMMMCPDGNRESEFLSILENPHTISIDNDNRLTLKDKDGVVAEFSRGIDETMLLGKWGLEFMKDSDLESQFPLGKNMPTLEFNVSEKRLHGNAGCNNYSASFEIDKTAIIVGPAITTRMSCPNLEGEYKFTNLLSDTSELKVSQDTLIFYKNGELTLKLIRK